MKPFVAETGSFCCFTRAWRTEQFPAGVWIMEVREIELPQLKRQHIANSIERWRLYKGVK
jgi:hypothetical protein